MIDRKTCRWFCGLNFKDWSMKRSEFASGLKLKCSADNPFDGTRCWHSSTYFQFYMSQTVLILQWKRWTGFDYHLRVACQQGDVCFLRMFVYACWWYWHGRLHAVKRGLWVDLIFWNITSPLVWVIIEFSSFTFDAHYSYESRFATVFPEEWLAGTW